MGKSSINRLLHVDPGSPAALEVGRRVRDRRREVGLTQEELARPLSKAFVSAVENGMALPSLGTLWLFAARLGTRVGDLVDGVNGVVTPRYTPRHGRRSTPDEEATPHRRR
jgi:transcriptional regulator with XRE-family HTH domain